MGTPLKGKYKPTHPEKYKGDSTQIVYRSSWELAMMKYFDHSNNVIEWSSEELVVWYHIPFEHHKDGRPKMRRYFPDFLVKMKQKDGGTKRFMIEVKPECQTKAPKVQKKKTKRYLTEVATWATNSSKWQAAMKYCKQNDIEFKIVTEKTLGIFQ